MPRDGQARIEEQLREEVERAQDSLTAVQQELEELCDKRKKWPELEPGAEIPTPPSSARVKEATALYQRQRKIYVMFHRAYLEVKRCFNIAAAMSPQLAALKSEFETATWCTGQEGIHPRLVAEQCVKTQLYTIRLMDLLNRPDPQDAGIGSVDLKHRGHPSDPVVAQIRAAARRIWEDARREGSHITHEQLCERLDANRIELPPRARWKRLLSWSRAYDQARAAVKRWLSQTLSGFP